MMSLWPTFPRRHELRHALGRWLESALVSATRSSSPTSRACACSTRCFKPLEINDETLAYSAHQEVGQGGHFLGAVHTLERFRECFYRPLVSSTENYERWNRNGGNDTAARASEVWKKTLEEYEKRRSRGSRVRAEGIRRPQAGRS